MENVFCRTEMLIGENGLKILRASTISVFGLGGVGSYAAEAVARSGVGHLVLVDFDTVSPSNINRQLLALEDTVGMSKVRLMAGRIKKINSLARVTGIDLRYTPGERDRFFEHRPDYVIDAIDDIEGKVDLIKYCLAEGIPLVSCMGTGNKLDPARFRVGDISETSVCPMARVLRARLRKEGIYFGLKVVFSTEQPRKPFGEQPGAMGKKVPASISFVPPVAGLILAGVAVRELLERMGLG